MRGLIRALLGGDRLYGITKRLYGYAHASSELNFVRDTSEASNGTRKTETETGEIYVPRTNSFHQTIGQHMKKITWLLSILSLLAVMACTDNPTTTSPEVEKSFGKIELSSTGITAKRLVKKVGDSVQIDYDLGAFKASDRRFFGFKNVGTADIESLTVSCSEGFCNTNPGFMTVLQTDETSSITPILEIQILHGLSLTTNEMMYPLIPYGRNSFYVEFKGKVDGEDFYARFDFTLVSIYLNLPEPAKTDYLNQDSIFVGPEMAFESDSCNVYSNGFKVNPGDNPDVGYDNAELRNSRFVLNPLVWRSDCVHLQALPKSLQGL